MGLVWDWKEGGVKNDIKVADLWGWADGTAINDEEEFSNLPEGSLRVHYYEPSLVTVEFRKIIWHPEFYIMQAVD